MRYKGTPPVFVGVIFPRSPEGIGASPISYASEDKVEVEVWVQEEFKRTGSRPYVILGASMRTGATVYSWPSKLNE